MDLRFERIDEKIASLETTAAQYSPYLGEATQHYVALIREYADQLGRDEVKQRLVAKGDEVAPYCVPCMATLYDEAKKY